MSLRIESFLPFALFAMPISGIIAVIFIAVNGSLEIQYSHVQTLKARIILLLKWLPWNILLITIGLILRTNWTYQSSGQEMFDSSKIWVVLKLVLLLSCSLVAWRVIAVLVDKAILRSQEPSKSRK